MKEFEWQLSRSKQLTPTLLAGLDNKIDHFGEPFALGDKVLVVMLAERATACKYRQQMASISVRSIPTLLEQYDLFEVKSGIPRYVRKTT